MIIDGVECIYIDASILAGSKESIKFFTDINISHDGTSEDRYSLNDQAAHSLQFDFLDDNTLRDVFLGDQNKFIVTHDFLSSQTTSKISGNGSSAFIACDTSQYSMILGSYCIDSDSNVYKIIQIGLETINSTGVSSIEDGFVFDKVVPDDVLDMLLICKLSVNPSSISSSAFSKLSINVEVLSPRNYVEADLVDLYKDIPVIDLTYQSDNSQIQVSYNNESDAIDASIYPEFYVFKYLNSRPELSLDLTLNEDELDLLKSIFYALKGSYKTFWLCDYSKKFNISAADINHVTSTSNFFGDIENAKIIYDDGSESYHTVSYSANSATLYPNLDSLNVTELVALQHGKILDDTLDIESKDFNIYNVSLNFQGCPI